IHRAAGRTERAGELLWQNMLDQPCLVTYRELSLSAAEHFPRWRESALALPTTDAGTDSVRSSGWSDAIAALVWEGAVDVVRAAAREGGCASEIWLRLVRCRAVDQSGDALPVLVREVERLLELGQRAAYQEGAAVLCEARVLAARTGGL